MDITTLRLNFLILAFFYCFVRAGAQDLDSLMNAMGPPEEEAPRVMATFKTTRLVNLQTIEQVKRGELDFRISHRFDDIGGPAGGISTLYGFDNVADIRLAFDYGITDRWAIGIARSKGAHLRRQILDFNTKVKMLSQSNKAPVGMSLYGAAEMSTMKSSTDSFSTEYFTGRFAHRINYVAQLLIARKISSSLSLELAPTIVHRNLVHFAESNTLFAIGAGLRYKFTKRMGVIADYFYRFDKVRTNDAGYYAPLGIGIEIETGGHVFHLLFSNNKSLLESQYITETRDRWVSGQFRFGFNISRVFNIVK